jgi:hypothetical protein
MTTLASSDDPVSQDPREVGRWDVLPYTSQVESIHMALLHTGKVLYARMAYPLKQSSSICPFHL